MNTTFTFLRNIFLLVFLFFSGASYAQIWQPLGVDDVNQPYAGGSDGTSVAIHPITGDAYLAFSGYGLNGGAGFVRKFNSETNQWEDVGGSFSAGALNNVSLAINSAGVLYVGFGDSENQSKATVKKFNTMNNMWETVGTVGFSAGFAASTSIAIGSDDTVYICYGDGSLSNKATVKKFDGTNWVNVGTAGFTALATVSPTLAVGADNTLYVGFASWYSGQLKASVMHFDQTSWQLLGTPGFSTGGTSYTRVAVNPVSNVPYIAYSDFLNGYKAKVKKFNGTAWEDVGAAGFSDGHADRISFAISSAGTPFIAYNDVIAQNKATVMKYNGTVWETVGVEGISIGTSHFIDITTNGNTPYLSFTDVPNMNKATLMKFDGSAWVCQGGTMGISEESTSDSTSPPKSSDLIISDDGTPYMGYSEHSNDGLITVKKYNVTTALWENVGVAGFSAEDSQWVSMDSHQNVPYIAFTQTWGPYKATVMKFNGTAWEHVGSPNFTAGAATEISMAIAPDGTPYIIFKDDTNLDGATVMKFNGTTWETVGNAGFSGGAAYSPTIMIAADGTPYVAFTVPSASSSSGIVMQFNGTAWETVGGTFNNGDAFSISMQVGPDGFMYVAYADYNNEGKAVVKKFTGITWENVGADGFSMGVANNTTLAIKPDGQLFVSYQDLENEGKATVMRYNGIDWVPVGNPGISEGPAYNVDMVITQDGASAIIAYSSPCMYSRMSDITCTTNFPLAENQAFCNPATVANLVATGDNIRWYNTDAFGTPLDVATPLSTGTYYVSQMQDDCEGPRTEVAVVVNTTPVPDGESSQQISTNDPATATIEDLIVSGNQIQWYDVDGNIIPAGTQIVSGTTYYATQTIDGCESMTLAVAVEVLLGVGQFDNAAFSYYPNPATDKLQIVSGFTITEVEVYTLYGQKVNLPWNASEGVLDVSGLANSTYLVCVHSEKGAKYFKIVKGN